MSCKAKWSLFRASRTYKTAKIFCFCNIGLTLTLKRRAINVTLLTGGIFSLCMPLNSLMHHHQLAACTKTVDKYSSQCVHVLTFFDSKIIQSKVTTINITQCKIVNSPRAAERMFYVTRRLWSWSLVASCRIIHFNFPTQPFEYCCGFDC